MSTEHVICVCGSRSLDTTKPDNRTWLWPNTRAHAQAWLATQLLNAVARVSKNGQTPIIMAGEASMGPDVWAREWAQRTGVQFRPRPADWEAHKKKAGLVRNEAMTAEEDELIAVWDGHSRGTDHKVGLSRKAAHPVTLATFRWREYDGDDEQPPPASKGSSTGSDEMSNETQEAEYEEAPKATTALQVRMAEIEHLSKIGLAVQNLADAQTYAKMLCKSRLVPRALQENEYDTLLVILRGADFGFSPVQSTQFMFVTPDGTVGMKADPMVGLVLSSDKCEYFEMTEASPERATFVTKRVGGRNEQSFTFTIEMAALQGLTTKGHHKGSTNNWDKMPVQMLIARAKSALARLAYPDVVGGIYTPEELLDSAPEPATATVTVVETPKNAETKAATKKDKSAPKAEPAPAAPPSAPSNGGGQWDLDSL